MSSSLRVYVGVYLEIDNNKEQTTTETYVDSFGRPTDTKFNPNTGEENKLSSVDNTTTVCPDPVDIIVEGFAADEFLSVDDLNNDTTIWIPRFDSDFKVTWFDSDDEPICVDLLNINPLNFLDRFYKHYDKYLVELRMNFDYRVKFGLITFYM